MDFELIKNLVEKFELDDREIQFQQFIVAKENNELLGFGRIRNYVDCSELCSLGIIEPKRLKGIGKQLTKKLISKAEHTLYLVCIIPDYFQALGFKIVTNYPPEMEDKLNYCTLELSVPEKYVVMKYDGNDT